ETCIYSSFLNTYLERAMELLSDIVFNSTFPEKELEKEKDVVIDEINSYLDNPSDEIFDEFEKLLFPNHSIGRYILGSPSCIKKFNRNKIKTFIDRCYNTNEIVICSVGKIDFEKLKNIAEKYFSEIKNVKRKWLRNKFSNYKPFNKTIFKKTQQTHCIIGNIAYHNKDKRKTPLILLNNILGGPGMNSRLSMKIREKYGFCYNIESNYSPFSDTGIFSIYMGTENENIEKTIFLVNKELETLRNTKLGTLQLQRAKQQLIGQIAISYEQNLNEMLSMGKSFLVFNKVDTLDEINSNIEKITSAKLLEVSNHIFAPENLSILTYKSEK
ncbi:MAG: insulinase family protein, partial [Bacteroidetes bacterium]|nr:insulinase family protein [Bacteroidota bacterium]